MTDWLTVEDLAGVSPEERRRPARSGMIGA
jgi:hypothetical protein